jgi:ACS family tartrate transporter-like MFS transporter
VERSLPAADGAASDTASRVFDVPPMEKAVLAKVARRLIPFIALIYAFNILDRTNVGIAALQMKPDLGFSNTVYGLGAGMFFVGYFLLEVPSNLILDRVGARVWIARIMFTWGVISSAMLFVRTPFQFYTMRFLLGMAEAGFYPGMILYLTYWFPTAQRGRSVARFVAISAVVGVIGGPISGLLLGLNGWLGLKGWQWLFLIEGVPSCLLGFAVLRYLTDRPEQARWLKPAERDWLVARLAAERQHRHRRHSLSFGEALKHPALLHYAAIFFLYLCAGSGLGFFVPQILKAQTAWTDQQVATAGALPGLAGAVAMLAAAALSDRTCERKRYFAAGASFAAIGIVLAALSPSPWFTLAALVWVSIGSGICQGPFWAMPTSMLTGAAAAGGIAFINSVGNLGQFAGPVLMGRLKDVTGGYQVGLFALAGTMLAAGLVTLVARHDPAHERATRAAHAEQPATVEAATG